MREGVGGGMEAGEGMDGGWVGGRCGGGGGSGSSLASMLRPALWQIATILEGAGSRMSCLGVPE